MKRTRKSKIPISQGESRHHIFWKEDEYSGRVNKGFREHPGLIVPLPSIQIHDGLHKSLPIPPPKPLRNEMLDCTDLLSITPDPIKTDITWGVKLAAQFFGNLAVEENRHARRQQAIADHLTTQLNYLLMNALAAELSSARQPIHLVDRTMC